MSRGTNLSGRTLVVDEVVQLTKEEEGGLDTFAMQLEGEAQKLTKAQVEYKNAYSISVSGNFELTTDKDAEITLNVYRNGVKTLPSDSVVFGSKISYVSQNGKYNSNGEYASHYKRTIKIDEISSQSETILCVWKGNSENAVPLTTSFTLNVGSINQYAYSKYTDEEKVKEQPLVWYSTIEGAKTVVSNDLRYLWMRQSSIYDFAKKEYKEWKYYKTDIEYEGRTKDDTADDTINTIVPAKFINFLFSKQTYTVNRRSTDADLITFSYSFTGYKSVSVTTPWTVSGFTLTEEQKTASSITISVPHNNTFSSIVVSVTVTCDEKEFPWTMTLTPIDITEPERYAGVLESIPQGDTLPDGSKAINGDWFVLKSTNIMYVLDMSYAGDTAPWKPYDNSNALSTIPLEKVSTALVDMINLGTTDKTTATLLGVFKALCADQGFVKYLQTYSLTIGKGNFKVEIQAHNPTTGEELANPIFKVSYGGNTVFQIDASTGNVFIGKPNASLTAPETGFMYNASTQEILSKSSNFSINANGKLSALDGYFKGKFDCNVIKTDTQKTTVDTFSISTISNRQAENLYNELDNKGFEASNKYKCSLSGIPNVNYVSFRKVSDDSYSYHTGSIVTRYYFYDFKCQAYIGFYNSQLQPIDISSYVEGRKDTKIDEVSGNKKIGTECSSNEIGSFCIQKSENGNQSTENRGMYFKTAMTLKIYTGGQILVVDLPTSKENLPKGALYLSGVGVNVVL